MISEEQTEAITEAVMRGLAKAEESKRPLGEKMVALIVAASIVAVLNDDPRFVAIQEDES